MITITGIGDHLRPEWLIIFTGMRRVYAVAIQISPVIIQPPHARLCVGDREARADRQRNELIDSIAAGAPVCKLFFVEALGDTRVPFGKRQLMSAALNAGTEPPENSAMLYRYIPNAPTANTSIENGA